MKKLAIIGCGNMAEALCVGGDLSEFEIFTYTPSETKAKRLAEKISGRWVKELKDLPQCDYYMIGCKPQHFKELARELKSLLTSNAVVISMMAAISIKEINQQLGHKNSFRIMPNLSVARKSGVNLYYSDFSLGREIKNFFGTNLFFQCQSEDELDDLMLLSGCGPGIIGEIVAQLERSYQDILPEQKPKNLKRMLLKVIQGLVLDLEEEEASSYVDRVCSKGGVTEKTVLQLREDSLYKSFRKGLEASKKQNNFLKN